MLVDSLLSSVDEVLDASMVVVVSTLGSDVVDYVKPGLLWRHLGPGPLMDSCAVLLVIWPAI